MDYIGTQRAQAILTEIDKWDAELRFGLRDYGFNPTVEDVIKAVACFPEYALSHDDRDVAMAVMQHWN